MADYGISPLSLPSGTNEFGGTEGFMAPEIIKYNCEEEYTEKVDCFSFGMFIYELITMHQPFKNHKSETTYPSYLFDLMAVCWSQSPKDYSSASQIVFTLSDPGFTHLYDVILLSHLADVIYFTRVPLPLTIRTVDDHSWSNDNECVFSHYLIPEDQNVGVKCIVTLKDRYMVAIG
ncbi:Protein kinase domain,Protein kinase-like domain [Cinara cedri]|uniref:Protein kinase domain,Protein kinase-like domain n=1 Tax=Cinara cedri TaxID=506608 RepID=A0A5E4M504_9HEMI|nr:Protein kinase domain,Protein kinase-like domain [Cinara cedri]